MDTNKPLDVVELFSRVLGDKMDEYVLPPQSFEIMQCSILKFDEAHRSIVVKYKTGLILTKPCKAGL